MEKILLPVALLLALVITLKGLEVLLRNAFGGRKARFNYARKEALMTPAERECYEALVAGMGSKYLFFPQIHLDALVTPTSNRQERLFAFRHINQKSVDFVACDHRDLRPLFVIELDDQTHQQPKRQARDQEVERILRGAGLPLVRIENCGRIDAGAVTELIQRELTSAGK